MNDNHTVSEKILPFNVWFFGFAWIFLHIVAYFILNYLSSQILLPAVLSSFGREFMARDNFVVLTLSYALLMGGIVGILIGTIQWYLLQYYLEWPKTWITATTVGWMFVNVWYSALPSLITHETINYFFLIRVIGAGLFIVLFQWWFILRELVDFAYLWIAVGILSEFASSSVVLYLSGFMNKIILYGYDGQVLQVVNQIVNTGIQVSCLIGLLYLTLRRNSKLATQTLNPGHRT